MATEKSIKNVLDLLTTFSMGEVESLQVSARAHAKSMRTIADDNNVVAMGISEKVSKGKPTGELALTFYVDKKIPLSKLKKADKIPATVPGALAGQQAIPTDVVEIGKIVPELDPFFTRKPLQPGYSIGHHEVTAGTFGAVVSKGDDVFILSNSHVLANSGNGKKGDSVLFPGIADGGLNPGDLVAHLEDFVPFTGGGDYTNLVDCAIARPTPGGLKILTSEIKELGIPKGTAKAERGMKIIKMGRTTGKTMGEVKDVHFRTQIFYEGVGKVGFLDQVFCTRYSDGGDSGSLVLEQDTGMALGLHFAGASGGSVFSPISEVLRALNVSLVTMPLKNAKTPTKGTVAPVKKGTIKKATNPPAAKKAIGKKVASKKGLEKKTTKKKAVAKNAAPKKSVTKKKTAKTVTANNPSAKKAAVKKAVSKAAKGK